MALDQDITTPAPRSRRAMLAGALGGLAGLVVGRLGSPDPASAAAGSPLIIGSEANNAGTSNTQLIANSNVVTFKLYQQGPGTALMGYATPSSGGTRGVYGRVDSPNGDGVQARNAGAAGTGAAVRAFGGNNDGVVATTDNSAKAAVAGLAAAGTHDDIHPGGSFMRAAGEFAGLNGVIGATYTGGGQGVTGLAPKGYGVVGLSEQGGYPGVFGSNAATSGAGSGVHGEVVSPDGSGVYGHSVTGNGVMGQSNGGVAVRGHHTGTSGASRAGYFTSTTSDDGRALEAHGTRLGLYALTTAASGASWALYGHSTSPSGVALYADGNAVVSGTLSKGAGSFKIDHPLDPANKYLFHSFVESPDMMNIYNGNAKLDHNGEATVELPAWFGPLNRDFRYQLTPLGSHSPVYVKAGVKDNRFTIAGGEAGQEISWQVTGIRQDAYAKAHPIEVEVSKTADEKGRYLHPKELGKSIDKGLKQPVPAKAQAAGPEINVVPEQTVR